MQIANALDARDASGHQLLYRIVCVLVDHPSEVAILAEAGIDGATLLVTTHPEDVGKVIGSQGRTARALRAIMGGVGKKLGRRFTVLIQESDRRPEQVAASSRENLSL
ncbi:MAG: KH domain-containing protein [Acidobacteriaceae bacterium]|jgi:predicted RNA-binding protein YlqC (UPF0109 family)